jgi:hypothetical protein
MMRKVLICGVSAVAIIAASIAALRAAPPPTGQIYTSPVAVSPGSIPYNGGPQSSAIFASGGTFTANSGSAVTVVNANVTANSVILFGLKTVGGTPAAPFMVTVTPGTGFTVNSGGSDTSVYNYWILG